MLGVEDGVAVAVALPAENPIYVNTMTKGPGNKTRSSSSHTHVSCEAEKQMGKRAEANSILGGMARVHRTASAATHSPEAFHGRGGGAFSTPDAVPLCVSVDEGLGEADAVIVDDCDAEEDKRPRFLQPSPNH